MLGVVQGLLTFRPASRTPQCGARRRFALPVLMTCLAECAAVGHPYLDRTHDSKVFGESRHYRVFLPAGYDTSTRRYPVIYYFHGHSDRYTLEKYDDGQDTVPKIAAFVATHDAIVVAADGYVARDYTGFYGGTPYDVMREGGQFDYGEYFLELVPPYRRHLSHAARPALSRHLGLEYGRLHEPVSQRPLPRLHRQRLGFQSRAGVLRRRTRAALALASQGSCALAPAAP